MRENIYYWKCDNPLSQADRKRSYFKDKYDRAERVDMVRHAAAQVLGEVPSDVEPLRVDGNHLAFIVTYGSRRLFFRADDGVLDDDYMLAESALMRLAADAGVPVPRVLHTDVSRQSCPCRFQIMDFCPDPSLDKHHRAGTLDGVAVAEQLGGHLRRLHGIRMEGFGFVDTDERVRSGRIRGLDATYAGYFHKRLDDHLGYLRHHALLAPAACDAVTALFERHAPHLERAHAVLVHRDMALWNVLGTPGRVTAIIDWDDAVGGDPADDFGVLQCFYDEAFMAALHRGYWGNESPPQSFVGRVWLHTLRNLLWKTALRHSLGYFEQGRDFFLNTPDVQGSLKEHTLGRLHDALDKVERLAQP